MAREHVTRATPRKTPRHPATEKSATQATFVRRTQTRRDTPRHQRDTVSRLCQRSAFSPHAAFWWHVTAAEKALLCGFLRSEQLTFAQESYRKVKQRLQREHREGEATWPCHSPLCSCRPHASDHAPSPWHAGLSRGVPKKTVRRTQQGQSSYCIASRHSHAICHRQYKLQAPSGPLGATNRPSS